MTPIDKRYVTPQTSSCCVCAKPRILTIAKVALSLLAAALLAAGLASMFGLPLAVNAILLIAGSCPLWSKIITISLVSAGTAIGTASLILVIKNGQKFKEHDPRKQKEIDNALHRHPITVHVESESEKDLLDHWIELEKENPSDVAPIHFPKSTDIFDQLRYGDREKFGEKEMILTSPIKGAKEAPMRDWSRKALEIFSSIALDLAEKQFRYVDVARHIDNYLNKQIDLGDMFKEMLRKHIRKKICNN